jgi:tetratricopeptide (TPR) repeat protein
MTARAHNQPLFPHQKLDWLIARLEEDANARPEDPTPRVELARALFSRGHYHGGGEAECNKALLQARKALSDDPQNAEALVLAGLSLIGMDRGQAAQRYFDQALQIDAERADLRLALGKLARSQGEAGTAVRQLEAACRVAPDAWEPHLELGRTLMDLSRRQGHPRRLVERAQYHLVQALKREPTTEESAVLLKDLGQSCLLTGRAREAEKFFLRLKEHRWHAAVAWHNLGLVAMELGKYNNAIQHFRRYLRERPDDPRVLAKMAMAWFQLGEYPRAREACHQALLVDPDNVEARHALGCTLLEEGEPNEALRVFRDALKDRPDHMPTFLELARTRRLGGDVRWLAQALHAEVEGYDRLSPATMAEGRAIARARVDALLAELRLVGPSTVPEILGAIHRTQDEALRFALWESACGLAQAAVADEASTRLADPGRWYGPGLGGMALAAADALPENRLTAGLGLDEAALKKATIDRHGPAHDVAAYRANLEKERARARAHQGLLLLAIATRRSAAGKQLLRAWAESADPELAVAAWTGLALYGDPDGSRRLLERAAEKGHLPVAEELLSEITPPAAPREARRVGEAEPLQCSTCGRRTHEATHMIAGGNAVICDHCVQRIVQNRATLSAPDDATCDLCGRSPFETAGLYRFQGVNVCNHCVQLSLGLMEREEVDAFLAEW